MTDLLIDLLVYWLIKKNKATPKNCVIVLQYIHPVILLLSCVTANYSCDPTFFGQSPSAVQHCQILRNEQDRIREKRKKWRQTFPRKPLNLFPEMRTPNGSSFCFLKKQKLFDLQQKLQLKFWAHSRWYWNAHLT